MTRPIPWSSELSILPTRTVNEFPNRIAFWDDGKYDYLRPVDAQSDPEVTNTPVESFTNVALVNGQLYKDYIPVKVRETLVPRYLYMHECGAGQKLVPWDTGLNALCWKCDKNKLAWELLTSEPFYVNPEVLQPDPNLLLVPRMDTFPIAQTNRGKPAKDVGGYGPQWMSICNLALEKSMFGNQYLIRVLIDPKEEEN